MSLAGQCRLIRIINDYIKDKSNVIIIIYIVKTLLSYYIIERDFCGSLLPEKKTILNDTDHCELKQKS